MDESRETCLNGDSDGRKLVGIPPTVVKWKIKLRTGMPDRIILKYRNKIEMRHLEKNLDGTVQPSRTIVAVNTTEPEKTTRSKDFWKV